MIRLFVLTLFLVGPWANARPTVGASFPCGAPHVASANQGVGGEHDDCPDADEGCCDGQGICARVCCRVFSPAKAMRVQPIWSRTVTAALISLAPESLNFPPPTRPPIG